MLLTGAQFRCTALLGAALLGPVALTGCQNAPQQLSLYAPFGPAAVPPPALTRANAAPYYSPPNDDKNAPAADKSAPGSTASSSDNKLSHYDPYRGILLPGEFKTSPVTARSAEATADVARAGEAGSQARTKPSSEEPIRIVEAAPKGIGSAIESTIARATEGQRNSGSVQFQASPPSGAVRAVEATPATITASPTATIARSPKPPITPASVPAATPSTPSPANGTLRMLAPPPLNTPPASATPPGIIPAQPAASRRLSLWDEPRDGSRVEPASYSGAVLPASSASTASGSWRQRTP